MSIRKIYLYGGLTIIIFFIWMYSDPDDKNEAFPERVKIALRDVGNQLLLSNQDSTSLVLPVIALTESKYKLSFQQQLSFLPNRLVSIVDSSFQRAALPNNYRVEVLQCSDHEVAYSYEISKAEEKTIIPCAGRLLPENCYSIEVMFSERPASFFRSKMLIYLLVFVILTLLVIDLYKRKKAVLIKGRIDNFTPLGRFNFYPDQNKLVKEAVVISLSKKECELLTIFIANPNQIIKRDELTKKVWEDKGVFVGRSLDTYISRLRKKLKEDDSITLTNVHGVGYKLEIIY
jgi:hypothetical protein